VHSHRRFDGYSVLTGSNEISEDHYGLHALAYNLGNFVRTLATAEPISASLKEKPAKIGAKVVRHGRYFIS
jgi:hypothetical protein